MKKFFILIPILALVFTLPSCKDTAKVEDTKKVAEEHNDAKFKASKESDAQFLVNAAETHMEVAKLGELAQTNGMMSEVKKLGEMMKTDHATVLKDLQGLAARKQVTLPMSITNDGQASYAKLMDEKGMAFDKKYCDMMVSGHEAAIDKFEQASTSVTDPDIKVWAASMLPTLRAHLDASITCQKNCEKMKMK